MLPITDLVIDSMIRSFADKETEALFARKRVRRIPPDIRLRARRKLLMIDAASEIRDLRNPPGNRLEVLIGNREGQYSIRINRQWRVCFRWRGGDAFDVEIVDYHD